MRCKEERRGHKGQEMREERKHGRNEITTQTSMQTRTQINKHTNVRAHATQTQTQGCLGTTPSSRKIMEPLFCHISETAVRIEKQAQREHVVASRFNVYRLRMISVEQQQQKRRRQPLQQNHETSHISRNQQLHDKRQRLTKRWRRTMASKRRRIQNQRTTGSKHLSKEESHGQERQRTIQKHKQKDQARYQRRPKNEET